MTYRIPPGCDPAAGPQRIQRDPSEARHGPAPSPGHSCCRLTGCRRVASRAVWRRASREAIEDVRLLSSCVSWWARNQPTRAGTARNVARRVPAPCLAVVPRPDTKTLERCGGWASPTPMWRENGIVARLSGARCRPGRVEIVRNVARRVSRPRSSGRNASPRQCARTWWWWSVSRATGEGATGTWGGPRRRSFGPSSSASVLVSGLWLDWREVTGLTKIEGREFGHFVWEVSRNISLPKRRDVFPKKQARHKNAESIFYRSANCATVHDPLVEPEVNF